MKENNMLVDGIYKIQKDNTPGSEVLERVGNTVQWAKWNGNENQKWNIDNTNDSLFKGYYIYITDNAYKDKLYLAWKKTTSSEVVVEKLNKEIQYSHIWTLPEQNNGGLLFRNFHSPWQYMFVSGNSVKVDVSQPYSFYLSNDMSIPKADKFCMVITSDPQYPWTKKVITTNPKVKMPR